MTRAPATLLALMLATPLALTAGCGSEADGDTLTVFAAASLTSAFTELGERFEDDHEGVTVRLGFGGSSDLAEQIRQGAPADVFASADAATMGQVEAQVSSVHTFATNTLEIAVPRGNPAGIGGFGDLSRPGLRLVICAAAVPCGSATAAVARHAGVTLTPVSEEQSVTDVLGKVTSGEADAGVVYRTDVLAAGDAVQGVPFPEAATAVNRDQIGTVVRDGGSFDLAEQFVDFVLGATGRQVLADAGFGAP